MATLSVILARSIPRTEEPGGLPYQGWQSAGHERLGRHRGKGNGERWKNQQGDRAKWPAGPPEDRISIKYK